MKFLILPEDLARRVARGAKKTHRVPKERGRLAPEVSDSLTVQYRRGTERVSICRVEVLTVEQGVMRAVTEAEWLEDGRSDRGEYLRWWREHVERVPEPASSAEPSYDTAVWVIRFQVDTRNFLAARPGLAAEGTPEESPYARGYTSSPDAALRGAGQAVDDDTLHDFVRRNREKDAALRPGQSDEDEARRLERELKEVRKRAARTGIDVTLEVAVIQHQIGEIRRKVDEAA